MDQVVAAEQITEDGYRGVADFVHAEPGDTGEVLEVVDEQWRVVRWTRGDSVAQCHVDELTSA